MKPPRFAYPRYQAGVGLIELMIAMVIGLLIVGMVTSYYLSSRQSYQTTVVSSELNNAQRYAVQLIGRQLLQAGYSEGWMDLSTSYPSMASHVDHPAFATGQIVAGADSGEGLDHSSELWVRYQGSDWFDQDIVDCAGREVPPDDGTAWVRIYLDDTSTLRCQSGFDNDNDIQQQPLLNGVEALQFSYLDDSGSFQDHDDVDDWTTLRAVRVEMLVSSETDTWDAPNEQSFDWQGADLTFDSRRMFARFNRVVTLRNVMERQ
ncbi:hypothetical protein FIU83_15955 [Halomonas sp. THAF5a]|uniref:PilW family protein n=1 Tax=Halomonas sp. THAF5a TaxID=2587844 RepID=UPI0012691E1C|nr:PilW family protein [Halomonas sp. THAF5a]QFU03135.1 hypothetical protein FIU83_15955 [Halomonas sp. THAF5a]